MRRWLLAFAFALGAPVSAWSAPLTTYVHVAQVSDRPVASEDFLRAQWASAHGLFGGIEFAPQPAPAHPMAARIESRADRDALAKHAITGAVNVFVVESLADVDEPGRQRLGVHWRAGGTHYVIVATYAVPGGAACPPQYTCKEDSGLLAHELGHFFGLSHDSREDNLMSYSRSGRLAQPSWSALWLDDRQRKTMHLRLTRELTRRTLTSARTNAPATQN